MPRPRGTWYHGGMDTTSQPQPPSISEANIALRSAAQSAIAWMDILSHSLPEDKRRIMFRKARALEDALDASNAALDAAAFGPLDDLTHRESRA